EMREQLRTIFESKKNEKLTFSRSFAEMLEEALLEIYFHFWQYGDGFSKTIPDSAASADAVYQFISQHISFNGFADDYLEFNQVFYYQVYNELGYYQFETAHLEDLLLHIKPNSLENYYPGHPVPEPDEKKMHEIEEWLSKKGNNIIYIYGEQDPYTACAVKISDSTNALQIVQKGVSHRFLLAELTELDLLKNTLKKWLEL
ncbi:MAG: hypothetical protein MJB14_16225, partial [Spirochaetes bacterium]|nr:hypothetical protein [Spirochaetota bacterium]